MPAMLPARPADCEQSDAHRSRICQIAGGIALPDLRGMLLVCARLAAIHDGGRLRSRSHSRLACRRRLVRHAMHWRSLLRPGRRGRRRNCLHRLRRPAPCLPRLRARRRGMRNSALTLRVEQAGGLSCCSVIFSIFGHSGVPAVRLLRRGGAGAVAHGCQVQGHRRHPGGVIPARSFPVGSVRGVPVLCLAALLVTFGSTDLLRSRFWGASSSTYLTQRTS